MFESLEPRQLLAGPNEIVIFYHEGDDAREGSDIAFNVRLLRNNQEPVVVHYVLENGGDGAQQGEDFLLPENYGVLVIPPGQSIGTVPRPNHSGRGPREEPCLSRDFPVPECAQRGAFPSQRHNSSGDDPDRRHCNQT